MNLSLDLDKHRYQRYFVNLRALYERKEIVVYTGLILSLFAIAFFALFALKPTLVTITTLIKEIQVKREVNEKLQSKINALRQAQVNFAQVANLVPVVNEALPTDPHLQEIIYPLEVLTQRHNLAINAISFGAVDLEGKNPNLKQKPKTTLGQTEEITFDLSLKGEYQDLKMFLESLEKLRRILTLNSFSFSKSKIKEVQMINFSLNGQAFYLPKEKK